MADGPVSPRTHAVARLQLTRLTETKADLESKVAQMQARGDQFACRPVSNDWEYQRNMESTTEIDEMNKFLPAIPK